MAFLSKIIKRKKFAFDEGNIVPKNGLMSSFIFENETAGVDRAHFFTIIIPVEPFESQGLKQKTGFVLEFIRIDAKSFKELGGNEYLFPVNPEEGYIDGSIMLGDANVPFDATDIVFSGLSGRKIKAKISGELNFRAIGMDFENLQLDLEAELDYGHLWIHPGVLEAREKNLPTAKELAGEYVDLEAYEEPKCGKHMALDAIIFEAK